MAKWKCEACGEAKDDDGDLACVVDVYINTPTICPVSGEACEWNKLKDDE